MLQLAFDIEGLTLQHIQVGPVNLDGEGALQAGQSFIHGIFGGLRVVEDNAGKGLQLLLNILGKFLLVVNGPRLPGSIAVRPEADIELIVEESGRVGAIVGPAQLGTNVGDHWILHQDFTHLRREATGFLKRDGVGQSGANPQRALVEMRHEFAADEGHEKKGCGKNRRGHEHGRFGVVEAPLQLARVFPPHPFEGLVLSLVHALLKPVPAHHRHEGQGEDERTHQRDRDGVRHGSKELCGGSGERINGQVASNDDGYGIEDGTIDVFGSFHDHFEEVVTRAFAFSQYAEDVLHHHQCSIDQDSEIDGADGEQVGGDSLGMKKDEGEQHGQGNRECNDDGSAHADQETHQHHEDENHPHDHVVLDGIDSELHEIAAVVIGANFDIGGQDLLVELRCFRFHALQHILRLFAAAHHDDAFDSIVSLVESKFAEPRSVPDRDAADVVHPHRYAVLRADDDVADILGIANQTQAAHVVELAALGIKSAAGVGIVH